MTKLFVATGFVAAVAFAVGRADAPRVAQEVRKSDVLRLDAALDAIIAPDAKIQTLVDDYFGANEGPVWVNDGSTGYLLFSDQAANKVWKITANGKFSVYLENSGFTNLSQFTNIHPWDGSSGALLYSGRLLVAILGSVGLGVDPQGRLVLCQHGDRALMRVEKDGHRTILADHYQAKHLNGPNDLTVAKDGTIYFTDIGVWGNKELPTAFYQLKPNGKLTQLHTGVLGAFANGIALSPDEKSLYVAVTYGRKVVRYDLNAEAGTVSNEVVLVDLAGEKGPGAPDGLKIDRKGNLFFGGAGGMWITSPTGKHLGTILGHANTNLAFGDPDGKALYMVGGSAVTKIRLVAPGI
jgi:gluconolactonase